WFPPPLLYEHRQRRIAIGLADGLAMHVQPLRERADAGERLAGAQLSGADQVHQLRGQLLAYRNGAVPAHVNAHAISDPRDCDSSETVTPAASTEWPVAYC